MVLQNNNMTFTPSVKPLPQDSSTTGFKPSVAPLKPQPVTLPPPPPTSTGNGFFSKLVPYLGASATGFMIGGPVGAAGAIGSVYALRNPEEAAKMAGGFVKSTAQLPIQFIKGAESSALSLPGKIKSYVKQQPVEDTEAQRIAGELMKPETYPVLGEVKQLSATPGDVEKYGTQTPGETALQAADIYLTGGAPGAGRILKPVWEGVKKAVGPFSKWAKKLSTISEETISAARNPKTAKEIEQLRAGTLPEAEIPKIPEIPKPAKPEMSTVPEFGPAPGSPEELKGIGTKAYETAQAERTAAMEKYKTARRAIIDANEGKIIQGAKQFKLGTKKALAEEGISVLKGRVNLTGSQFEGAKGAESIIQRVYRIMARPAAKQSGRSLADDLLKSIIQRVYRIRARPAAKQSGRSLADDLLTRREALSTLMTEIPPEQKNLRRVVASMREAFDTNLDNILGKEASELRAAYSQTLQTTQPVIKSMTKVENGKIVFSEDKAYSVINTALKESKFDNTEMLRKLDELAGSTHAKDLKKIEEGRIVYEQVIEKAKLEVAEINRKAKEAYVLAKDARSKALLEAKRVQDAAKAKAKAELDALKQLDKKLKQVTPAITDSYFSNIRQYISKLPWGVGSKLFPFFSPVTYGNIALTQGLKAGGKKVSSTATIPLSVKTWLLAHMLTSGYRSLSSTEESQE